MSDEMILSIVLLAGKSSTLNFDFSFKTACFRNTHSSLLVFCILFKMTSILKLGRPYENGKALGISTRKLVITDLIDGMSAKAVGKKY